MPTLVLAALIVLLLIALVLLIVNTIAAVVEIFVKRCFGVGASMLVLATLFAAWVAVVYSALKVVSSLA